MTGPDRSASSGGRTISVPSRLFGPLQVAEDSCIRFPEGLLGFAGDRRFVLLPATEDGIFWLQCLEDGALIFLVVDPFRHFPDYAVEVPEEPESADQVGVFTIVTLPGMDGQLPTTNLQGPLIIDFRSRSGRQQIIQNGSWTTKHPVHLLGAGSSA